MNNKQIISMMLGYAGISQSKAANILHKAPQSLNMTLKRDNLTLVDFITLCNILGMTINIKDSNNNVVLSIRSSRRDKHPDGTLPANASEGDATNTPAK